MTVPRPFSNHYRGRAQTKKSFNGPTDHQRVGVDMGRGLMGLDKIRF